jgi:hypothetical protein
MPDRISCAPRGSAIAISSRSASLALARNGSPRGYVFTIKTPDDKFIYLTFGSVGSDPLNKDGKGGLGNGHPTSFQN